MLFVGHDTLWRIGGTCALTAVGAFLLFAASSLFEREETRQAEVLATALILAEELLLLGQIWSLFGRADERAEMTLFHRPGAHQPAQGPARACRLRGARDRALLSPPRDQAETRGARS